MQTISDFQVAWFIWTLICNGFFLCMFYILKQNGYDVRLLSWNSEHLVSIQKFRDFMNKESNGLKKKLYTGILIGFYLSLGLFVLNFILVVINH